MTTPRLESETRLRSLESSALTPYVSSCSSGGISVSWEYCPKGRGGNIKRGKRWGRLIYNGMGKQLTREDALNEMMLPPEIRKAKLAMLDSKLCAICGNKGAGNGWGWLKYLEHSMDICPKCVQRIYRDSPKPWMNN